MPRVTLRDRVHAHEARTRRVYLRLSGLLVLFFAGIGGILYLHYVHESRGFSDAWSRTFIDHSSTPEEREILAALGSTLEGLLATAATALACWVGLPILIVAALVLGTIPLADRYSQRRLYFSSPATAQLHLRSSDADAYILRRGGALIACVFLLVPPAAGMVILFTTSSRGLAVWLATLSSVVIVTLIVVVLLSYRGWQRRHAVSRSISPLYASRLVWAGVLRVAYLAGGACTAVLTGVLLEWHFGTRRVPVLVRAAQTRLDDWRARAHQLLDVPGGEHALVASAMERAEQAAENLRYDWAVPSLLSMDHDLAIGACSLLLVIVCFFAFIDVGLTFWRTESLDPVLALAVTLAAVVVLEFCITQARRALVHFGWDNYFTSFVLVLVAYLAGQGSAFLTRLRTSTRDACPRCTHPVESATGRCSACATDVRKLRDSPLIGNEAQRELHHASCAYILRMAQRNQRTFETAEEAYWEDYDNCAFCLGGSRR